MNIGIIGAGAIATYMMETIGEHKEWNMHVQSVFVRDKEKYAELASAHGVTLYTDIDAFLQSDIDIVVEAANVQAVKTLLPTVLEKKSAVVISIGALVDATFFTEIKQLAKQSNHHLYLPSGAIGGLDVIQHAKATNNLSTVALETRKPAHTLVEEPIEQEQIVFQGTAAAAIKAFPKNINVAIALGLAGVGMEETNVTMIADSQVDRNIHRIKATGGFGNMSFQIENAPMPSNANTSYLAAMSVIGTLQNSERHFHLG